MRTFRALLLDFERKPELGKQLREVFAASTDPAIQVDFQAVGEPDLKVFAETLSRQSMAMAPGITLLAFDHPPESHEVGFLVESLHDRWHGLPSVVIAPVQYPSEAIDLFHQGAVDVWLPPLRAIEIVARAMHWLEQWPPEEEGAIQRLKARLGLDQFIGESPKFIAEIQKIPSIAAYDVSVLIRGETGTGKEICARALHYLSLRSDGPFVAVNCGALPVELIENELFGHEAGAFTGANSSAGGLVERTNQGTLFLDEVDSLPLPGQVKLLRFLQDKQYRRLGSTKEHAADVRIVAATNADLAELMQQRRFREDLYYRLSGVELCLPPLRERGEDVVLLARHFLERCARQFRRRASLFTAEAVRKLQSYAWPGNVRELEHIVTRAVLMSQQPVIHAQAIVLPKRERANGPMLFKPLKARFVEDFEKRYLSDTLQAQDGNISAAARAAGMDRRAFWQLLRKHDLTPARPHSPHP